MSKKLKIVLGVIVLLLASIFVFSKDARQSFSEGQSKYQNSKN
jgi:hypothetical protein